MESVSLAALQSTIKKWDDVAQGALSVSIVAPAWSLSHQGERRAAAASLIKLVILAAALRMHEHGALDLAERLPVTTQNRAGGAGVLAFIDTEAMRVASLIDLMISISDNTASNILIHRIGMATINDTANALGLKQTELQRHFWDAKAQAAGRENRMSTDDIVTLLRHINAPTGAFSDTSRDVMLAALAKQQFKAKLLDRARCYPGLKTFSKTGEMPDVEGDACILRLDGRPEDAVYAAVIMIGPNVVEHGLDALREIGAALLKRVAD